MKKLISVLLAVLFLIAAGVACTSPDEGKKDDEGQEIPAEEPKKPSELSGESLLDGTVNWFGRHYYDEEREGVFFSMSASGFEVYFYGTELIAEVSHKDASFTDNYLAVAVDDVVDPDAFETAVVTRESETLTLVKGLQEGSHVVRVYKKDESVCGKIYLHSLQTDGRFEEQPAEDRLKIEVFGDSITCGYGLDALGTPGETFSSSNENVCDTYAFLLARMLGAELSVLSASGWGMKQGLDPDTELPKWFEKVDIRSDIAWDVAKKPADIAIICLGANDNTSILLGPASEREQRIAEYKDAYSAFVGKLLSVYPDVTIICCYGFYSETALYGSIREVVADYQAKGNKVYGVQVASGSSFYPTALDGHPNQKAHQAAATALVSFLEDKNIAHRVRENVK